MLIFFAKKSLLASAGDFNGGAIPLTFDISVASQPCPILLFDDLIIENQETFLLSLSLADPEEGTLSTSPVEPSLAMATITDDSKCSNENRMCIVVQ